MRVTKPIDVALLQQELTAAAVPYSMLLLQPDENAPGEADLLDRAPDGTWGEPVPEAEPVVAKHNGSKPQQLATFESAEDAERMRLVNERARTDPAYAALADLTLGKER